MLEWISKNKIPSIFITIFIIVAILFGIIEGLSYLSAQKQQFIKEILPGAMKGYEEYGVLPSLALSQAILESNWGKSHIENNLFGIKATESWSGNVAYRNTKEFIDGEWIVIETGFRAYNSFADSVEDYARLLGRLSRYKEVLAADNYKQAAIAVWEAGYATDPKYPQKLTNIIEQYNLQQYDAKAKEKMQEKYKYFKDVPDGIWYSEIINRLYENNIINGIKENGELYAKPNESITRLEVFVLIDRVLSEMEYYK